MNKAAAGLLVVAWPMSVFESDVVDFCPTLISRVSVVNNIVKREHAQEAVELKGPIVNGSRLSPTASERTYHNDRNICLSPCWQWSYLFPAASVNV